MNYLLKNFTILAPLLDNIGNVFHGMLEKETRLRNKKEVVVQRE